MHPQYPQQVPPEQDPRYPGFPPPIPYEQLRHHGHPSPAPYEQLRNQGQPAPRPYEPQLQQPQGYPPQQPPGPVYYPPPYPQPPYPQPPYPQPPYPQPAYAPVKRTEFGWASIVVGGIALFVSWLPLVGYFVMAATLVLVMAGFLGRHERTTVPACFGAGLLILAVGLHVVSHVLVGLYRL